MRNFLQGIMDFFSNKVIYAITFVLALGALYYAKISSNNLNLRSVTNMSSFLDHVFPRPELYFSGLLAIVLSVALFGALTISSMKLSYIPAINISCGVINLIGIIIAIITANYFMNTLFFAIIVGALGFVFINALFD